MNEFAPFGIEILPRHTMSWNVFVETTPQNSIALDGIVLGGPRFDPHTRHLNFDHHDGVVREATMSTAMQVYFAIKGGLGEFLRAGGPPRGTLFINDTDQDTAFAVWLLMNYRLFEGTQGHPVINRMLALIDRWDITGGAFPMNLRDDLVAQFNWVFEPYTSLRKSGTLAHATREIMRDNLEAVMARLTKYMMGEGGKIPLDIRYITLHESPQFRIIHEIGGNDARYHLFSQGMNAFISQVACRPDGRFVYTIGRRSQYIPFPVEELYDDFNLAEGFTRENGWNGSSIIGGSSRLQGSGLSWEQLRDITVRRLLEVEVAMSAGMQIA